MRGLAFHRGAEATSFCPQPEKEIEMGFEHEAAKGKRPTPSVPPRKK
tara:strand:- start:488 stop:628 length:141 start_codon:yes stop_codon:yes gene_type:complete